MMITEVIYEYHGLFQQGLRPIQIWVPDMRSPSFVAEAHKQSLAVARSPHANEDQDFIDGVSVAPGGGPGHSDR
jgi:Protein  of unknown function (DUF3018)